MNDNLCYQPPPCINTKLRIKLMTSPTVREFLVASEKRRSVLCICFLAHSVYIARLQRQAVNNEFEYQKSERTATVRFQCSSFFNKVYV